MKNHSVAITPSKRNLIRPFVRSFSFILFVFALLTANTNAETAVRFRLVRHFAVVVPVKINGIGPFDFLVDTGSNTTLVSRAIAPQLSFCPIDQTNLHTIAGTQMALRGYVRQIRVGDETAENLEVLSADLPGARLLDSHIVGILGQNFLRRFNYLLDYESLTLTFDDAGSVGKQMKGNHIPIKQVDGIVTVSALSREKSLQFVLDSGSANLVLFVPPFGRYRV